MVDIGIKIVRELGSFGVLLLLGVWGLRTFDRLVTSLQVAVEQFARFQVEVRDSHAEIIAGLDDIRNRLPAKGVSR